MAFSRSHYGRSFRSFHLNLSVANRREAHQYLPEAKQYVPEADKYGAKYNKNLRSLHWRS